MIVIPVTDAGVPESTLIVASDVTVPPAGGVGFGGEKLTCAPPGRELALKATAELNDPIDVIETVSMAELPAPTLIVGAVSDREKSAPEVIVSAKDVV